MNRTLIMRNSFIVQELSVIYSMCYRCHNEAYDEYMSNLCLDKFNNVTRALKI